LLHLTSMGLATYCAKLAQNRKSHMRNLTSIATTLTIVSFVYLVVPLSAAADDKKTVDRIPTQSQEYVFLKEGTLIRGSNLAIYLIDAGKRRLVPDQSTFNSLGLSHDAIHRVSDEQLKAIPELPPVSKYRNTYKNGTLLKGDTAAVFVISSGGRRLIPNEATFEALGYRWEDIQQISNEALKSIPEYTALPAYQTSYREGDLLKASGSLVYVINGGRRRLIPDEETFKALGYKQENIQQIPDEKLSAIPELPPIAPSADPKYR